MSDKIRLAQMFYSFDVESAGGGLSRFAIELGRNLDRANFEVVFCSLGYNDSRLDKKWIVDLKEDGYESFAATTGIDEIYGRICGVLLLASGLVIRCLRTQYRKASLVEVNTIASRW